MILELEIPIKPQPHQSVRFTRSGRTYQPKKVKEYKQKIQEVVLARLPDHFSVFTKGSMIEVRSLHYIYAYPKSMPKKNRYEGLPKTTKPDLHDNLNKALFDALEGVLWEQDQNIVSIRDLRKYYGEENKIILKVVCLS